MHTDVLVALFAGTLIAAYYFSWHAVTVPGFFAGVSAAAFDLLVVTGFAVLATFALAAVAGLAFAARSPLIAHGAPRRLDPVNRLGAAWLVLSFPAAVYWCAFTAVQWMGHR